MSLNFGRHLTAIPGPSVIPDRVLSAMHRSMPNIYAGEIVDVSHQILDELPEIARTTAEVFVAITNGHGTWEMSITNVLSRGEKVLVLSSGRFAEGWGEMAASSGAVVETLPGTDRGPVDPAAVQTRLAADTDQEIKAILMVQIDTSSSVLNDVAAVRVAMDAADHPALLMVDCIASLGCVPYEMDEWGVDVTIAATQKGLMVPPGLGFVWANDRAKAAHQNADMRTGYWDWTARSSPETYYLRFCGTPPVQHLYAMAESLAMLREEGLENVWARHEVFGTAVRTAVDTWAAPGGLELNITDPAAQSNAVTTILTNTIDSSTLRTICEEQAGLTVGLGLLASGDAFRIGHMGHLNPPMLLGTLATVEAALVSMGAPLGGSGVAAATEVIAKAFTSGAAS